MTSTGRRPRIPLELAIRIDEARGDTSFERFVCETLDAALDRQADVQESLWGLYRDDPIAEDLRLMDAEYERFRDRVRFRRELEAYERDAGLAFDDEPPRRGPRFVARQRTRS